MKNPAPFQKEIITTKREYIDEIKQSSSKRTTGPISTKLSTKHSWVKGIQICSNKVSHLKSFLGQRHFQRKDNWKQWHEIRKEKLILHCNLTALENNKFYTCVWMYSWRDVYSECLSVFLRLSVCRSVCLSVCNNIILL